MRNPAHISFRFEFLLEFDCELRIVSSCWFSNRCFHCFTFFSVEAMMDEETMVARKLGINGLGRIAKLSIWHHVERKYFSEIVVNIGREVGTRLADIAHFLEKDSSYGNLHNFLYGSRARRVIEDLDEKSGSFVVNGIKTTFLRNARNPAHIDWRKHGVDLVVDATGAFIDPTASPDEPHGSARGHFASGARKVIVSAPF